MANISRSRKSGFITRNGVSRRESLWFSGVFFQQTVGGSTAVVLSSLNVAALGLRPFTVVRTRGVLSIRSDQAAAREQQICAYGHAVVSDQSVAVGVTAIPTPATDDGSDLWFLFQVMQGFFEFRDNTGTQQTQGQLEVDSKAMRKVEDGQDLVQVLETQVGTGCVLSGYMRTLIKLH